MENQIMEEQNIFTEKRDTGRICENCGKRVFLHGFLKADEQEKYELATYELSTIDESLKMSSIPSFDNFSAKDGEDINVIMQNYYITLVKEKTAVRYMLTSLMRSLIEKYKLPKNVWMTNGPEDMHRIGIYSCEE